ncbi:MAG: hypothetical protein IJX68_04755 [Rikenellaceae bacterium]|nr:hypothetical protein [Rikenellaceae bacterium]
MTVPFIILAVLVVALTIALSETWKKKEQYRCRVFELTNGKEGSNLVKIEPDTLPPPPPMRRIRRTYRFVNLRTCGDQSCLDNLTDRLQEQGYMFQLGTRSGQTLTFMKIEEIKEDEE